MTPPNSIVKAVTPTLVAGRPHSLYYLAGVPGAATIPAPGIGGATLTADPAQIPFTNPVSGDTYLARFHGQATQPGALVLCDRLWHNSGYTITNGTAVQTHTGSGTIPARDAVGTNAGTGVYAAVEVSAATGAGTPTLTHTYANTGGTIGRTATNIIPTVATSAVGAFYPLGLQAGDLGIQRSISLQLSATWTSGTIHTVLYRELARLELTAANVPNAIDALTSAFPRLYDNTVPFVVFIPSTTTASNITGQVAWTQG